MKNTCAIFKICLLIIATASGSASAQTTYNVLRLNDGTSNHKGILQFGLSDVILENNPDGGSQFGTFQIKTWNGSYINAMRFSSNGWVGIGTTSPSHPLTVQGTLALFGSGLDGSTYQRFALYCDTQYGLLFEAPLNASSNRQNIEFNWRGGGVTSPLFIKGSSANVGIGTTTPDYKLTVNGKIKAEEVQVVVDVPADYVFEKDYSLMPLLEVEKFVGENKHLPGMPNAQSLIANGWQVGEMNNKLLEKVEELTLYIIEQNKRIETLEKKLSNPIKN